MSISKWFVLAAAMVMPWVALAQGVGLGEPKRADGLAVYLSVDPSVIAQYWAQFHRSPGGEAVQQRVHPELDRHIVVVLVDEKTGKRVGNANIDVTLTHTASPGRSYEYKLDLMATGANATYGTVVTVDPTASYRISVVVKRADQKHPTRVSFDVPANRQT